MAASTKGVRRGAASIGLAALALVLTGALVACGSSDSGSSSAKTKDTSGTSGSDTTAADTAPAELNGTSWTLVSYRGSDGKTVDAASTPATVAFGDATSFSGNTGCNAFTGTYTAKGAELTLELGPMTRRACTDEAVGAQESAITASMPEVTTYATPAEGLVLSDADGVLFTFEQADTSIEGSWTVTGINNGKEAVVSSETIATLTATFADGKFSGFGGCNQVSGGYEASDTNTIAIGPLAATMMACEGDASTVESQYTAALEASKTYEVSGDQLTLRDADGATQVTATRKAAG